MSSAVSSTSVQNYWIWPSVGSAAVNYGLDSEIFDSERFPHIETFVRETIQNSLDARVKNDQPVIVRFAFHEDDLGRRERYLTDLKQKKDACSLRWPEEDENSTKIRWLVVEDSNTSGLKGDLADRTSDYWNYWLNFGISNKDGTGRGGRGIGRITFLLASHISTVIGVTRREHDGKVAICGMSMLRPGPQGQEFKSSYAYFAPAERVPIFDLFGEDVAAKFSKLFKLHDYSSSGETGLSLVVPYPHDTLNEDGIVTSAIEHFAPAIISGILKVTVGGTIIDAQTIDNVSSQYASKFPRGAFAGSPTRVLQLIRMARANSDFELDLDAIPTKSLAELIDVELREKMRTKFTNEGKLTLTIKVPLTRRKMRTKSALKAVLAVTPTDCEPSDFFYREGMALPEVQAKHPAEVDLILQADSGELVRYLNFCEGKAHLDLLENKEVKEKLRDQGFSDGVGPRRFVKRLMQDLRALVLPDTTKPDAKTFSSFFSTNKFEVRMGNTKKGKPNRMVNTAGPIEPRVRPFFVEQVEDGFKVKSNIDYQFWPLNLRIEIAYSDGSISPSWSRHDFELSKLQITNPAGINPLLNKNAMTFHECQTDFNLLVTGFDIRRELIVRARHSRNA